MIIDWDLVFRMYVVWLRLILMLLDGPGEIVLNGLD